MNADEIQRKFDVEFARITADTFTEADPIGLPATNWTPRGEAFLRALVLTVIVVSAFVVGAILAFIYIHRDNPWTWYVVALASVYALHCYLRNNR
jgi:multisubunit Na+/H+ antiporter MnhC subunit